MSTKKNLLIVADAGVDTGFAQVTHNLVEHLSKSWNISILGVNYFGDPHPIQKYAKIYSPTRFTRDDLYGFTRILPLIDQDKPDVILIINDPWIAVEYGVMLREYKKHNNATIVLYTPIDAECLAEKYVHPLNDVYDHVVGYTQFGINQLQSAGLTTSTSVIPHGVNTNLYKPIDKELARRKNNFPADLFIVNVTDRNQIRKRIDLAFYYFAEWVKTTNKSNKVKIHYHGALNDVGWDIMELAHKLKITSHLMLTSPNITADTGISLQLMPYVYAAADVGLSTTMGEG